jgi:hypothetical protein
VLCGLGLGALVRGLEDDSQGIANARSAAEALPPAPPPNDDPGSKPPPVPPPCAGLDLSNRFTASANGDPLSLLDAPHPLEDLPRTELVDLVKRDVEALGSIAVGAPNRGALVNGMLLPNSEHWEVVNGKRGYGTAETISSLLKAFRAFYAEHPDAKTLKIGDLSPSMGGYIRPHRSHQTGQDVDIGDLYSDDSGWYTKATRDNLDRKLTWSLLCQVLRAGPVRFVFVDRSIQPLLREHAETIGEDATLLTQLFEGIHPIDDGVIRHAAGHSTHFHVRFASPVAEWTGRQLFKELMNARVINRRTYYPMPKHRWRR